MKKEKLSLNELKVQSFVTSTEDVKGGVITLPGVCQMTGHGSCTGGVPGGTWPCDILNLSQQVVCTVASRDLLCAASVPPVC